MPFAEFGKFAYRSHLHIVLIELILLTC